MKIERLRAFMSRDKDRPRVIVSIDTDDGLTGWGECYNHGPDKALAPILDYLFDFIRGQGWLSVSWCRSIRVGHGRLTCCKSFFDGEE